MKRKTKLTPEEEAQLAQIEEADEKWARDLLRKEKEYEDSEKLQYNYY